MSRYPWRNTSEDIAGQVESQWETPLGAQAKADKAEENAKAYSDEKLNAHIGTGGTAHANAVPNGLAGFMTGPDKAKLDGIEERANHYVHPATHPPSIIAQDPNNRFVSDAEKAVWNAKASTDEATPTTKGLMSASDKAKLDESTASATPGTLVQRDASGRFKAATPSAKTDVARKSEVDTVQEDLDAHKADTVMHVTAEEHEKLGSIQTGAEVNQNAFSAVKVTGQGDVTAKTKTDALRIAGGTGITITTDPSTSEVKVTATGNATPGPHAETHLPGGTDVIPYATSTKGGLMSPEDKNSISSQGTTLSSHIADNVKHITVAERSSWNAKETPEGAQAKATQAAEIAEGNAKAYAAPLIHTHDASDIVSGVIAVPRLPGAGTTKFGIVKLYDNIDSADNSLAATAGAVKKAYDEALAAKQSGVDAKNQIVDAINSKGGNASTNDPWAVLANKIRNLQQATGNLNISQATLNQIQYGGVPFINKATGNFLYVGFEQESVGFSRLYLKEITVAGTILKNVSIGTTYAGARGISYYYHSIVSEDGVATVVKETINDDSTKLVVTNHAGVELKRVPLPYGFNVTDLLIDGNNVFFFSPEKNSIINESGTVFFTSSAGNGDSLGRTDGGYWLSKQVLIVDSNNRTTNSPCTLIITRNGTSFSEVLSETRSRGLSNVLCARYAYR